MPTHGVFDLATGSWNNTTPTVSGGDQINFTHTISGASLNGAIKEPDTFTGWSSVSSITGVLSSAPTNVYASASSTPLLFLPGTTPSLKFEIVYQVRTHDTKLAIGCTNVTQTITKTVTFPNPVQLNNRYNICIHLGLTGIKFSATVSEWDSNNNAFGTSNTTVDLPINVN